MKFFSYLINGGMKSLKSTNLSSQSDKLLSSDHHQPPSNDETIFQFHNQPPSPTETKTDEKLTQN